MVVYMKSYAATDGQSCVDMVNVQQPGDDQLDANSHVIIPMSNTSCSGRIAGFKMSLSQEQNGSNNLRFEVWSPTIISSEVYEVKAKYVLVDRDVKELKNYHFANVSFSENEAVNFEKGSFIGFYLPPNPRYTVWSINTTGYSYYNSSENILTKNINITRALNEYTVVNDSRPLIQIIFGKLMHDVISV